MKKLEAELWNLKVIGTDVVKYNQRFQELALLCVRIFPEESDKIERIVHGEKGFPICFWNMLLQKWLKTSREERLEERTNSSRTFLKYSSKNCRVFSDRQVEFQIDFAMKEHSEKRLYKTQFLTLGSSGLVVKKKDGSLRFECHSPRVECLLENRSKVRLSPIEGSRRRHSEYYLQNSLWPLRISSYLRWLTSHLQYSWNLIESLFEWGRLNKKKLFNWLKQKVLSAHSLLYEGKRRFHDTVWTASKKVLGDMLMRSEKETDLWNHKLASLSIKEGESRGMDIPVQSFAYREPEIRIKISGGHFWKRFGPWKGVVRFGKRGKFNPRYVRPFEVLEKFGEPFRWMGLLLDEHASFVGGNIRNSWAVMLTVLEAKPENPISHGSMELKSGL
ncbi:hypothetical protein Tco_0680507 [Tanacetum coccineum]|uniref:Reverse transcriptase domain-containing protein n=1 Tax=Tanacetum coccineum TaxID=301880 RepID=A0ABQ4XLY0_9ASTR